MASTGLLLSLLVVLMSVADSWGAVDPGSVINQVFCSEHTGSAVSHGSRPCPFPFKSYGANCYYASQVSRSWDEARSYCKGLEGDLATQKPYVLYTLVADILEGGQLIHWWVGGRYSTERHRFEYVTDGTQLDSILWHPGLPEGRGADHCVYLHPSNERPWTNFPCTNRYRFICQYP